MMITKMHLGNFKSWKELDIQLAPITLLFGTNSSGKSSILQALLLLKQTANSFDRDQHINLGGSDRDYFDFGSYRDLVFNHNEKTKVEVGLYWLPIATSIAGTLHYQVNWFRSSDTVRISEMRYELLEAPYSFVNAKYKNDQQYSYDFGDKKSSRTTHDLRPPISCYGIPYRDLYRNSIPITLLQSFFLESDFQFENLINSAFYLAPLRAYPQRSYPWTGNSPQTITPSGENAIVALIASEWRGDNLLANVAQWLKNMGIVSEFDVEALDPDKRFYETKVKTRGEETYSSLSDAGFGVSQVLPIITMLFFVPEGSIVLLEQPELHLHPSAQAVLTDLFLHVAETRKLQLIIESHSEHILARLQRRIAEADYKFATPERVKMYFCQPGENGSTIQPVEIDKYGQISNWPDNFFGDISGDLDAMTQAGLAQRRRELTGG